MRAGWIYFGKTPGVLMAGVVLLFAVSAAAHAEKPLSVRGPVYSAKTLHPGKELSVRFEVTNAQRSEVLTIARAVLLDSTGNRLADLGREEGTRLRLVSNRAKIVDFMLTIPPAAPSDSYFICLDLLPAKPGEPAYLSSMVENAVSWGEPFFIKAGDVPISNRGVVWEIAANRADITAAGLSLSSAKVVWGEKLRIRATVTNKTASSTGRFVIAALLDDRPVPAISTPMDSLDSFARREIELDVPIDTSRFRSGRHEVTIVVDAEEDLDDADRKDNRHSATFVLLPPPPRPVSDRAEMHLFGYASRAGSIREPLVIFNDGEGDVQVDGEASEPWIKLFPATLIVDPRGSRVDVGIVPSELTVGEHRGVIRFRPHDNNQKNVQVLEIPVIAKIAADSPTATMQIFKPRLTENKDTRPEVHLPYQTSWLPPDEKLTLDVSLDGGSVWKTIARDIENKGLWQGDLPNESLGKDALFKLYVSKDPSIKDQTSDALVVEAPRLTLMEPVGGSNVQIGQEVTIRWLATGKIDAVRCEYQIVGDQAWLPLAIVEAKRGVYVWKPPHELEDASCLFRVAAFDRPDVEARMPAPIHCKAPEVKLDNAADPFIEKVTAMEPQEMKVVIEIGNQGGIASRPCFITIRDLALNEILLDYDITPIPPKGKRSITLELPHARFAEGQHKLEFVIRPTELANIPKNTGGTRTLKKLDYASDNNSAMVLIRVEKPEPNPNLARWEAVVENFSIQPEAPLEDDLVTFKARYRNTGGWNLAHAYVAFFDDDKPLPGVPIPNQKNPLEIGRSSTEEAAIRVTQPGFRTFKAKLMIPDHPSAADSRAGVSVIKIQIKANPERTIRKVIMDMVAAYSGGDLDRFLAFHRNDFTFGSKGKLEDLKRKWKMLRPVLQGLEAEAHIEAITSDGENKAVVTYLLSEKTRWIGWDVPVLKDTRFRDIFVYENKVWQCQKREVLP